MKLVRYFLRLFLNEIQTFIKKRLSEKSIHQPFGKISAKLNKSDKFDISAKYNLSKLLIKSWNLHAPLSKELEFYDQAKYGGVVSGAAYLHVMYSRALDQKIKDLSDSVEFKKCVAIFDSFELNGKYINFKCNTFEFRSNTFLFRLIDSFCNQNSVCNSDSLDLFIKGVEDFFSGRGAFVTKVQLVNFCMNSNILNFSDVFRIRKITEYEKKVGEYRGQLKQHRYLFDYENSCFVAEYIEEFEVTVSGIGTGSSGTLRHEDEIKVFSCFSDLLVAMRIVKKSDVYLDDEFITEFASIPSLGSRFIRQKLEGYDITKRCSLNLNKNDESNLQSIFQGWRNTKKLPVSVERLSISMERGKLVDKLIDLIVGIEAFYKSSGSVHISLRPAHYLSNGNAEQDYKIYKFIDSQRELRNKIVHGSGSYDADLSAKDLNALEEILRDSVLKVYLGNKAVPKDSAEWAELYF